jgi:hypothetical protein
MSKTKPWYVRRAHGGSYWVTYRGPAIMRVVSDPLSYLTKERAGAVRDALNDTEEYEVAAHLAITMEAWKQRVPSPLHGESKEGDDVRKLAYRGDCQGCGKVAIPVWRDCPKVLDFGIPGVAPIEPRMVGPSLCDECELAAREASSGE